MAVKDPKQVFVKALSDLRRGTERSTKFYQEVAGLVADNEIKETLEARAFIADDILKKLDECFRLIGEKPVEGDTKLQDVLIEEFRKEIAAVQSTEGRRLLILMKINHLIHFRMGEYVALIAAADITGHRAVGLLLESCLAEKAAFMERTRRFIRERFAERVLQAA